MAGETKWTPGPWGASSLRLHGSVAIYAGQKQVGSAGSAFAEDADVLDANASLIAAAPDLYAALEDAVASLEQTLRWREGWECSEDEILGLARAALLRAQGADR